MKKLFIVLCCGFIFSCQNEQIETQQNYDAYQQSNILELNPKERMRNAVLEFTELQKVIHKNKGAFMEIYHLTDNDVYIDNYCSLSDLLNPNTANVYKKSNVPSKYVGEFKKAFETELSNNEQAYPNLNYVVASLNSQNNEAKNNTNSNLDGFYNNADLTFYIPYKTNDEDVIIDPYDGTTYVPGVIDAMEALGYKYNADTEEFDEVVTNDDYANSKMTVIIEPNSSNVLTMWTENLSSGGGSSSGSTTPNIYTGDCDDLKGTDNDYIRQVWVGHSKLKKQYDNWISFSGNGGGSEIIIGRTDSKEHIEFTNDGADVVVTSMDNTFQQNFSRKDIRKKRWKWTGTIWDFNWECSEPIHEQLYLVYEDDNTDAIDFSFDGIEWGDDTYGATNLETEVRTKDAIIRQWKRESTEFFATNLLDQGCDTKAGEYSFADREWGIYDCGDFRYTMPHRWVLID